MRWRDILKAGFCSLVLLYTSGCNENLAQVSTVVAQEVGTLANGLSLAMSRLTPSATLPQETITKLQGYAGQIQSVASGVSAGMSQADGQSKVMQMEGLLNSLVGAAANLNLPGTAGDVLSAATVALPFIEGAIGLTIAATQPAPQAAAMTPEKAFQILGAQ